MQHTKKIILLERFQSGEARSMFRGASSFDHNIGSWNVSIVSDMSNMFSGEYAFDQDLALWDVSRVTNILVMYF